MVGKALKWVSFLFFAVMLIWGLTLIHPFGEPLQSDMDSYFIQNAQKECAANNVVTSIVFDYRGFDTLGEATVLFTAVMGVTAIFRGVMKK
ncbi:MAG: hypothetical protein H5T91_04970 [Synergistetes bacterium]|nr:MAG: Uncharacterized protein XD52_1172 [bacterium 42_11]MBC7331761.1 hypothetical protein [Synergistota bacterium]MDK2870706.1 hypothetical protein [bacterium]